MTKLDELRTKVAYAIDLGRVEPGEEAWLAYGRFAVDAVKLATGLTDDDLEALMAGRARLLTWDIGEEIVRWHGGPSRHDAIDAMWAALRARKTEP